MSETFFQTKLPNTGLSIFSKMSALANEEKAINLSQGFPNFDCDAELTNLVHKYMMEGKNQYAPMAGCLALRQAISNKIKKQRNLSIDPENELCITAGATQALFTCISALIHPGDEVICIDPAYDSYKPAVTLQGGKPVSYQLKGPDFTIDWGELELLLSEKTKLFILNNPHNPLGTVYQESDLLKLAELAEKYNFFVLGDEVYEHLIFDDEPHISVLDIKNLRQRSFACYSFGKTFHITGWKIGYCIAPSYLMDEFKKVHQFNVFSVNTPVQLALADYLEKETWRSLASFFQNKRDLLKDQLKDSKLDLKPCKGTYFLTVDYSKLSSKKDVDYAVELCKTVGVATIPISVFFEKPFEEKILRICFAKTDEVLLQAGERLRQL